MAIRKRLFLSFALIAAALVITTAVSLTLITDMHTSFREILFDHFANSHEEAMQEVLNSGKARFDSASRVMLAVGASGLLILLFAAVWSRAIVNIHLQNRQLRQNLDVLEHTLSEQTGELLETNDEPYKSRKQIACILDNITDPFCMVDDQWQFTYVNKEAQKQFKLTTNELTGCSLFDFWLGDEFVKPKLLDAARQQMPARFEVCLCERQVCYLVNAYPIDNGMSIYFQDITEKKSLEREMSRLERLHLVGEMAAGIAHEIRNPMTTVRGYLQLFRGKFSGYEQQIDIMLSELDRANSIITEFLALAKNKINRLANTDLGLVVANLFPLIQAEAFVTGKDVQADLVSNLNIQADKGELRQLIINLAKNGLEAMQPGGVLTIGAYRRQQTVVLEIRDQGSGIAVEVLEKIGTPFFTTKEGGTGLGLATCYSIAARHNAAIEIETGKTGSTFIISFPACD